MSFGLKARIVALWSADIKVIAKHYPTFDSNSAFDLSSADAAKLAHFAF